MGGSGEFSALGVVGLDVVKALQPQHIAGVRELMQEYAASLAFTLSPKIQEEINALPGIYAPPKGRLLLALSTDLVPAGCVGLCPLPDGAAEVKRLYVRPAFRGRGLGRRLVTTIIGSAIELRFPALRLDTDPTMLAARHLYAKLGFMERPPFRRDHRPGALHLEKRLDLG